MNNTTDFTLLLDNGHGSKSIGLLPTPGSPTSSVLRQLKGWNYLKGKYSHRYWSLEFSDWQGLIDFSPKQGGLVGAAS